MIAEFPNYLRYIASVVICIVITLILTVLYFFSYPDIIECKGSLVSSPPPVNVYANSSGYLDSMFVDEGDLVATNQVLGIIKNNTLQGDIDVFKTFTERVKLIDDVLQFRKLSIPTLHHIGDLNQEYLEVYNSFLNLQNSLESYQAVNQETASLNKELEELRKLSGLIKNDFLSVVGEHDLTLKDFERNKELLESKLISEIDYEQKELSLLQSKRKVTQVEISEIDNSLKINQIERNIELLNSNRNLSLNQRLSELYKAIDHFEIALNKWEDKYYIKSPFDGKITNLFIHDIKPYLNAATPIFTILPNTIKDTLVLECLVPASNFGKVKVGSEVSFRLEAYPYQEFGSLVSEVTYTPEIPINHFNKDEAPLYLLKVPISTPIITTYGDTIAFRNELTGMARIVTEERNIFERILDISFD